MPDPRQDLDRLLDAEHRSLLSGDYVSLIELAARKLELLESDLVLADLTEARGLRRKLERNQALLAMAIHGFRSARRDIETIRCQRAGFKTYDKNGDRNQVGGAIRGFERKV
jgi:hypothetical protein